MAEQAAQRKAFLEGLKDLIWKVHNFIITTTPITVRLHLELVAFSSQTYELEETVQNFGEGTQPVLEERL